MWNLLALSIIISLTGCATKQSVSSLEEKLRMVHMQNVKQQTEIKELYSNQEALKGELSDLNSKFERLNWKAR